MCYFQYTVYCTFHISAILYNGTERRIIKWKTWSKTYKLVGGQTGNFPTKYRLLYETEDIGITNQWSCQCNYLGARTESMLQSYPTTVVPRVGNNRACDLSTRCNSLLNPKCPLNGTMLVHVNTQYTYIPWCDICHIVHTKGRIKWFTQSKTLNKIWW